MNEIASLLIIYPVLNMISYCFGQVILELTIVVFNVVKQLSQMVSKSQIDLSANFHKIWYIQRNQVRFLFICQTFIFSYISGDIEWGCGLRPEMIRDREHPGYWTNTPFCPEHLCLENNQSTQNSIDKDDYDAIDCNVSRFDSI